MLVTIIYCDGGTSTLTIDIMSKDKVLHTVHWNIIIAWISYNLPIQLYKYVNAIKKDRSKYSCFLNIFYKMIPYTIFLITILTFTLAYKVIIFHRALIPWAFSLSSQHWSQKRVSLCSWLAQKCLKSRSTLIWKASSPVAGIWDHFHFFEIMWFQDHKKPIWNRKRAVKPKHSYWMDPNLL